MKSLGANKEEYLKAIINALPIGLCVADSQGNIIEVNPLLEKIWGGAFHTSFDDNGGCKAWSSMSELVAHNECAVLKAVRYGQTISGEFLEIKRFNGTSGTIVTSASPVKNEKGEIIGAVGVHQDVSYQMELVKEVNELRLQKELATSERLRLVGQLVGTISHEVRNPLTSFKGFLQLFGLKEKYAEDKETFEIMIKEIDSATCILNELSYLVKDKAMIKSVTDLNRIIRSMESLIGAEAMQVAVKFVMRLEEIPTIEADEQEIRQLILSLITNAFEASMPGTCVSLQTSIDKDEILLTVRDQGSGIPEEIRSNIGTPFITTKDTGTGLGLSVCYRIVERHNASIGFDTSNKGTSFYIRFQASKSQT